jgi:TusA-related sulfurtransferase
MAAGTSLVLIVDDPRAVRDIPRAAEATGYLVAEVNEQSDGSWQIEIHK